MLTGEEGIKATCFLPASRVPPECTNYLRGEYEVCCELLLFHEEREKGEETQCDSSERAKISSGKNHWDTTSEWEMKEDSYRTISELANGIMVWIQNKLGGFFSLSSLSPFVPLSLAHPMDQHLSRGRYCPRAIWTYNKTSSSHMILIHLKLEGENFFTKFLFGKELYLSGKDTHTHSWWVSGIESDTLAALYMTEAHMKQREKKKIFLTWHRGRGKDEAIRMVENCAPQCDTSLKSQNAQRRFLVKTSKGAKFSLYTGCHRAQQKQHARGQQRTERKVRRMP